MFKNLFLCSEVRWIQEEIKAFFRSNDALMASQVLQEALKVSRDSERAKYSISVNKLTPQDIALTIISNVTHEKLVSGMHHVYRGVLSIQGASYRTIFLQAIRKRAALGYETEDSANKDIQETELQIQSMG